MTLLLASWRLQVIQLSRSPFFMSIALLTPVVYATIVVLMGRGGGDISSRALLGSGVMGAWASVLFGAGESLYMQRFTGTLRLLLGSPRGLWAPVVGFALATATLGAYSVVAGSLWTVLVLGFPAASFGRVQLLVAVPLVLVALVAMGILLAPVYVLSRQAISISNVLDFPVWLLAGVLVPASALWGPLAWIGGALPVTWAINLLDESSPSAQVARDAVVTLGLSALYAGVGLLLLRAVDGAVRRSGRLELR